MDNLKIGIKVLGRSSVFATSCSVCALLAACTTAPQVCVPTRNAPHPSLVRLAADDNNGFDAGRNDAILGADREPIVRIIDGSTTYTYDRQQIFNGRPWDNFRVTTRAQSVSQR